MDEGYIKYNINWTKKPLPDNINLDEIITYRNKLSDLNLIGTYANGIGFGNISFYSKHNTFIISGSNTGHIKKIAKQNFSLVTAWHTHLNTVDCIGLVQASSEALSHAAFYSAHNYIGAVIHIHNEKMWQQTVFKVPTTPAAIGYGTPEMALEIHKILEEEKNRSLQIIAMAGHREGIFTFGKNLPEAYNTLMEYYNKYI